MAITATPANQTVTTHVITLASLAASTTAGRQGTAIDNASENAMDANLGGKITTGAVVAVGSIDIWVAGSYDGTTFAGGAGASDAALTPAALSLLRLAQTIATDTTQNKTYPFDAGSVAALFGGLMPSKWVVFVRNNTGQALNGTAGNHEIKHTPVKYQSA